MKSTTGLVWCVAALFVTQLAVTVLAEDADTKASARAAAREKRAAALKAKREAAKEKREDARENAEEKAEARVDKRQDNQAKRIAHGIKKGYLTESETAKLQAQQKSIADLETSALADGKLTREEGKAIRAELNEASRCIWAEKHDGEGQQMATYRLGTNVFAKAEFSSKLENEDLSADEARTLMKDFHSLTALKKKLSSDDLSDEERATAQAKYDELINTYFEIR